MGKFRISKQKNESIFFVFFLFFRLATRRRFYPIASNVACARHFDVLSVIKGHSVRRATEISKRRNYLIYFKTSPLTKSWQDETKILSVFGVFFLFL